ncbi:MAG: hypothetical protein UW27_C0008G0054 [Parcubacteria group bacterium GW2011_GWA1_44_13]|nr:MAG: hypothetical protein UW27_C0008G0054 [Parcubacteria group bacterium GW2011_GWA1_44_13]
MKNFRFLEWKVYKDSQELFLVVLEIIQKLSREYRYELGSQLLSSGSSIILNIAEGSERNEPHETGSDQEPLDQFSRELMDEGGIEIVTGDESEEEESFL